MRFLFSWSLNPRHLWQAELLSHSFRRVGQEGELVSLLSLSPDRLVLGARARPDLDGATMMLVPDYTSPPEMEDDYSPHNKPRALRHWLERNPGVDEPLVVIDPDCVFIGRFDAVPGEQPLARRYDYLDPQSDEGRRLVARHCRRNAAAVQPVGIPLVMWPSQLKACVDRWIEVLLEIRSDPASRADAGWIAEMWAYAIAAAETGFVHDVRKLCVFNHFQRCDDAPLIHYCADSIDTGSSWTWTKSQYQAWSRLAPPPQGAGEPTRVLFAMIDELAAAKEAGLSGAAGAHQDRERIV